MKPSGHFQWSRTQCCLPALLGINLTPQTMLLHLSRTVHGATNRYTCTVIVEGRTDIAGGSYNIAKGSGSSTVTVTGE